MSRQVIISIGREFGSGGHEIAEKLAEIYELPFYDRDLLKHVSEERNLHVESLRQFDEKPRNKWLTRTEKGLVSSPAYNVAQLQFQFLRDKAESGESFVIVGRCAETVLKEFEGLISIHVVGDMDKKIVRTAQRFQISEKKAEQMIEETDRQRKQYHDSYSDFKWGDAKGYDISINSSRLGIDGTVKILSQYIDARIGRE